MCPELRRITGKYEIVIFGGLMAGKARFHQGFTSRFAIREIAKAPAERRRMFFCVLEHELRSICPQQVARK